MTRKIALTQGKFAIVDSLDFNKLSERKWQANHSKRANSERWWAFCKMPIEGKWRSVSMHRFIMNAPENMLVDHKNGNALDNRRKNLRICTASQNQGNRRKCKVGGVTKYKGLFWDKSSKRWGAKISWKGKRYHLGKFKSEEDAAVAYNIAAQLFFGEFASLNKI